MRPFHLAFPVVDLDLTERFYVDVLECTVGRRTSHTINFNFHGHQIVCHLVQKMPDYTDDGRVDGRQVPPFHFGLVMEYAQWHSFRDELLAKEIEFRLKPHIRYPGKVGEQATLFLNDPSGNAIEFKSFKDEERLFATAAGSEHEPGGGLL
ncbi:MAG: glyoxalase [Euryarchaeota archaeon]|jgi:extradiol dioxygenase family protein|nr:glyoxalase [Euryarchaeota archaeon]